MRYSLIPESESVMRLRIRVYLVTAGSAVVVFSKSGKEISHHSEESILQLGKQKIFGSKVLAESDVVVFASSRKIKEKLSIKAPSIGFRLASNRQVLFCLVLPIRSVELRSRHKYLLSKFFNFCDIAKTNSDRK